MYLFIHKCLGFPCVYMISVSNIFPKSWSGISHHDISVFWWKIYYQFSLPDKIIDDVENQQCIKDILYTLLQKEDIGIKILQALNSILSIPIHNEINLPKELIVKGLFIVKCYNYLDSDADFEFDPTTNILEVDPGLSLTTKTIDFLTPPVENDIFSFVHNNLNDISISHNKNYYDEMLPSFREAANMVNSDEDVQNFHKMIASFVGELKKNIIFKIRILITYMFQVMFHVKQRKVIMAIIVIKEEKINKSFFL